MPLGRLRQSPENPTTRPHLLSKPLLSNRWRLHFRRRRWKGCSHQDMWNKRSTGSMTRVLRVSYFATSKPTRFFPCAEHTGREYRAGFLRPFGRSPGAAFAHSRRWVTRTRFPWGVQAAVPSAANFKFNCLRIRPRSNNEIRLQLSLVSVIRQVHTGINPLVANASKLADAGAPLAWIVSSVIINFTGQQVGARDLRGGIRSQ